MKKNKNYPQKFIVVQNILAKGSLNHLKHQLRKTKENHFDDVKKINVATNGSILNKRVRQYIEKKNISLNISIDALTKNLYEQIRVNGDFDIVMKNFNVFKQYCDIAVMVNPMTNNWFQMKDFVDFCNENDVYLGYNTVRYPKHLSIKHMPVEMIEDVYLTLHKQVNTYPNKISEHNIKT